MKIISDNATYINSTSGTDTAAGDLIEEIFFGQQDATENPYTTLLLSNSSKDAPRNGAGRG